MKTKPKDFQFFVDGLKKIPKEEIKRRMELDIKEAKKEYRLFKKSFAKGECYLCGEKIIRCDYKNPCLHWLLRLHKRVKKRQVKQVLKAKDLFQVISYLRWIAKTEGNLSQINDFEAHETIKNLVYQENIKYKKTEWTFWVKKDDLKGHGGRQSDFPHYHLQMTIDEFSFIKFSDFHIPLSEWDIFTIHVRRGKFPEYKFFMPHGETYSDLFTFLAGEQILDGMKTAKDKNKAQFHLRTFIEAEPGKTLKGEDFQAIIKESKETGVPLAKLAHKLGGSVKTIVTPMNLVEPIVRKKPKKGR